MLDFPGFEVAPMSIQLPSDPNPPRDEWVKVCGNMLITVVQTIDPSPSSWSERPLTFQLHSPLPDELYSFIRCPLQFRSAVVDFMSDHYSMNDPFFRDMNLMISRGLIHFIEHESTDGSTPQSPVARAEPQLSQNSTPGFEALADMWSALKQKETPQQQPHRDSVSGFLNCSIDPPSMCQLLDGEKLSLKNLRQQIGECILSHIYLNFFNLHLF